MTTRTTLRSVGGAGARTRPSKIIVAVAIAVGLVLVLPRLSVLVETPAFVDQISFDNPTVYDLSIEVTGADRRGWLAIGTARRQEATTFEEIADQGEVWIFRFAGQGQGGGELRVNRSDLERSGWKVAIPERVGEELRAKGAAPPA